VNSTNHESPLWHTRFFALKMTVCYSETLVPACQTTWCYDPEDHSTNLYTLLHPYVIYPLLSQAYPLNHSPRYLSVQKHSGISHSRMRAWRGRSSQLQETQWKQFYHPELVLKIPGVYSWGATKRASNMWDQRIASSVLGTASVARFEEILLLSWQLKAVPDLRIPMRLLYIVRRADWKDARKVNIEGHSTSGNF
jgi:hypothetical protein